MAQAPTDLPPTVWWAVSYGETQDTHVKCTVNQTKSSLRKQTSFHDASTGFPAKSHLRMAKEIPYCWHFTPQIWVVLLISCALRFVSNKSEALPRSAVIPQTSFHGETNGGAKNGCCFLRLEKAEKMTYNAGQMIWDCLTRGISQDVYFQTFSKKQWILSMMGALFLEHNWGRWGH